jgi:uncharacterized phage protein (TIGR02218 family)
MKVTSAELLAHYASGATTLATLWKIERADGQVLTFTDHDEPITFEALIYAPTSSYDAGAVQTSASMGVDDVQLMGLMAVDGITAQDIEAGLWDAAKVEISEVNYRDLTMGANVLRFGEIGEIQRNGNTFKAELRGLMQYLQKNIGRIVTAACDADLGDARCGFNKESLRVSSSVGAVASNREFTAAALTPADTYGIGVVTWTTGLNAGLRMEMKSLTGGAFELQLDMPYAVAIGDQFSIVPGCNKIGRLGHCKLIYNNLNRFRGFEDIPGQTKILKVGGQ